MSATLHGISQFLREHPVGMVIFAICTGVAGNYVYDTVKSKEKQADATPATPMQTAAQQPSPSQTSSTSDMRHQKSYELGHALTGCWFFANTTLREENGRTFDFQAPCKTFFGRMSRVDLCEDNKGGEVTKYSFKVVSAGEYLEQPHVPGFPEIRGTYSTDGQRLTLRWSSHAGGLFTNRFTRLPNSDCLVGSDIAKAIDSGR